MNKQKNRGAWRIGDVFRLIGRRLDFRVVATYTILGSTPCIVGHTLDGKRKTFAREADIVSLEGYEAMLRN